MASATSLLRRGLVSGRGLLGNLLRRTSLKYTSATSAGAQETSSQICSSQHVMSSIERSQSLHTSAPLCDLQEFFDHKDNWGETDVKVGRPWRKDELRLKSNTDLHKLWYVLLKERNMLMTMETEYKRQAELFPSPERFEKVEESMENLLEVVAERNRAYNLLDTGETGEPGYRWTVDILGRGYWRWRREHYKPPYMTKYYYNYTRGWQFKYLRLWREKLLRQRNYKAMKEQKHREKLKEIFPHADID